MTIQESLEQFHGEDWDEELARQWSEAIYLATQLMFEGYQHRYHV